MNSASPRFLKRGRTESHPAGATLFQKGDPCSDGDIFYIISGSVTVECPVALVTLSQRTLRAGEVFGIEEPYGGQRHRSYTATVRSDVELYRWSRKSFDEAMGIYQELATQVIRSLSGSLRELNRAKS